MAVHDDPDYEGGPRLGRRRVALLADAPMRQLTKVHQLRGRRAATTKEK